jgi:TRAP-type C4-dicarboxylate transport system substrate-binding protein
MRKLLSISRICLFVICAAFTLIACKKQGPEAVKAIEIRVASAHAATHPTSIAMRDVFKKIIEEETGGTFKVTVHEADVLGEEKDLYDGVKTGSVEVVSIGTAMSDEYSKMLIADWPFLFRDLVHAREVFTGAIGVELIAEYNAMNNGSKMIGGWSPNNARTFSSNKPISMPADFQGQRICMPNNPIYLQLVELLGAEAISMKDISGALKQNVIDGQDNGMSQIRASGWYENQKYLYETNHMVSPIEILVNTKFLESLSPEHQAIIEKAATAATEHAWDLYEASIDEDRKFLQDNGMTIVQPTEEDKTTIIEMMEPLYADLRAHYPWAEELTGRIRAMP